MRHHINRTYRLKWYGNESKNNEHETNIFTEKV